MVRNSLVFAGVLTSLLVLTPLLVAAPAVASETDWVEINLASELPVGIPQNDRIHVRYFPYGAAGQNPAVILLPPLGSDETSSLTNFFARFLVSRGVSCAVICLPYHGERCPPGESGGERFTDNDAGKAAQAFKQAASDVSTVATWLSLQPNVDPRRLGVVGISLGAIVVHIAMANDDRLAAGVAALGSGDLADLRRRGLIAKVQHRPYAGKDDPIARAALHDIDPVTLANRNRPRHVLMIEGARDLVIPPADARHLWEALGKPPIRWVDTDHYGLGLTAESVCEAAIHYLKAVWNHDPHPDSETPGVYAITLKAGVVVGMQGLVTPALQWQFYSFMNRRDHVSLLHLDLGAGLKGPFIGLAGTLSPFVDLGIGHLFSSRTVGPYLSFHVVP